VAVAPRRQKGGTVYRVVNRTKTGKPAWEFVGRDKRQAERRDAAMKREIAAGTYSSKHKTGEVTVASEADTFFAARKVRTVGDEVRNYELHVLGRCEWFTELKIADVRPKHTAKLVDDLELPYEDDEGGVRTLAPKTIANIIGTLHTMFQKALLDERVLTNPIVLERGRLKRTSKIPKAPYTTADLTKVLLCGAPVDARVWAALAIYTGMREGEICGRRWRDWDSAAAPLGCLTVRDQYDGQPLKTDRPRKVPVHRDLAELLTWWRSTGWEIVFCRPPLPEDWIVPSRVLVGPHTRSSAYKTWRRTLKQAEVVNMGPHSARHSFITHARRGGAPKDVLEQVTHNARGDIVDQYTHWDWDPLCSAVACFPNLVFARMFAGSLWEP
jgi:integrase